MLVSSDEEEEREITKSDSSVRPRRAATTTKMNNSKPKLKVKKVNNSSLKVNNGPAKTNRSTKQVSSTPSPGSVEPVLLDDTVCRLCEKQFKPGTEALLRHYAWDHYKEKLEAALETCASNLTCKACKERKFKSRFPTRKDLIVHLGVFHKMVLDWIAWKKEKATVGRLTKALYLNTEWEAILSLNP